MKKKLALFLAFSISFLLAGNYYFFSEHFKQIGEEVVIEEAIDGDTVRLEDGRIVRLLDINTPEKGEFGYEEAKEFMQQFENSTVSLEVTGTDKYSRLLGKLYVGEEYLNLEIVRDGLAHSFLVVDEEKKDFESAERIARQDGQGIWQKSRFYGCMAGEINKKDEFIVIHNACNTSIIGWTVADESRKKYKLKKNEPEFTIYSGKGTDSNVAFYWNQGSVWNNDRDSIFIRDSSSLLVFYDNYGY